MCFKKTYAYEMEFPPTGIDYNSWDKRTADKYFKWYMEQIPIRIEYLRSKISHDMHIHPDSLDFSPESLLIIWRWFLSVAVVEKTRQKYIRQMKQAKIYKLVGESFINYEQLSLTTELIIRDIGMYLSQVLLKRCPSLEWMYWHDRPSAVHKDIYNNQPQLRGFLYKGKYIISYEPISVVDNKATNLLSRTHKETDLLEVYHFLEERLPDTASVEQK